MSKPILPVLGTYLGDSTEGTPILVCAILLFMRLPCAAGPEALTTAPSYDTIWEAKPIGWSKTFFGSFGPPGLSRRDSSFLLSRPPDGVIARGFTFWGRAGPKLSRKPPYESDRYSF